MSSIRVVAAIVALLVAAACIFRGAVVPRAQTPPRPPVVAVP